ncbi:hypothetical protein [Zooshikella ganghwensis]|uniref:hypothetical protein n=1 Tax=Zooshikella ganghwensis TaxID=202772 RepID=UPI0003FAD9FE|nr:hypothetical protein [Zooshikella ganghwensis]
MNVNKLKKSFLFLSGSFILSTFIYAEPFIEPSDQCKTLFANKNETIGTVCFNVDSSGILSALYSLTVSDTTIKEVHLHIGSNMEEIPQTRAGNPKVGNFEYSYDGLNTTEQLVPLTETVTCGVEPEEFTYYVAAHASIEYLDSLGEVVDTPTAWADGLRFNSRGNWATYFDFTVNCTGEDVSI